MDTARMTFNEAVHVLAAGHTNDMAGQALAIHQQRDRSEAGLKMELCMLKDSHSLLRTGYEALLKENEALKTRVAALVSLVTERAAAAAQQQHYDDPSGAAAQAEEVIDLTGDSEGEAAPAPAAEGGAAPAAKKTRADPRIFSKLAAVLPEGTPLSLNTSDLRWDGVYTKGGLVFQGRVFKSPYAVCRAHAQRITERHPNATKPGSGWKWLEIQHGPFKGKKLGEAYDAHYA